MKAGIKTLVDTHMLVANFEIPHAASPLEVVADIKQRSIYVGMNINAPQDRKSSTARLNWLLRQLKNCDLDLFPFADDGFVSPEVDIRRCDVAQTFMVMLVIIILHECPDLIPDELFAEFGERPHILRFVVALLRSASSAYRSLPPKRD